MLKMLSFLLTVLIGFNVFSQAIQPLGTRNNTVQVLGKLKVDGPLALPRDTAVTADTGSIAWKGGLQVKGADGNWVKVGGADSSLYVTYTAGDDRYITRETQDPVPTIGTAKVLQKRATDTTLEFTYTYMRRAATSSARATGNITSVVVDGISRSFTNPAPGGTGTGTVTITYTPNATRSVSIVLTTDDGKTASASVTVSTAFTYYRGFASNTNPTDAQLIAMGNNLFPATSKITSGSLPAPSSSSWPVFAYPASLGLAAISIFTQPVGYTLIQRNVTNTNGFTELFNIYVAPQPTSGSITYAISNP